MCVSVFLSCVCLFDVCVCVWRALQGNSHISCMPGPVRRWNHPPPLCIGNSPFLFLHLLRPPLPPAVHPYQTYSICLHTRFTDNGLSGPPKAGACVHVCACVCVCVCVFIRRSSLTTSQQSERLLCQKIFMSRCGICHTAGLLEKRSGAIFGE